MKVLILTSDSSRHQYFVRRIACEFEQTVAITEEKKNYYVSQSETSKLVRNHFEEIKHVEENFFKNHVFDPIQTFKVPDINDESIVKWALTEKFEVICLFGTSILADCWLSAYPNKIINLHLGLSPFYRGSATLFWPFVNKELEYLGTTIHLAIKKVDAGSILKRVGPEFLVGENYYEITNRLIRDSIDIFPLVVKDYVYKKIVPVEQELVVGKLFRKSDFSEITLKKALDYSKDGFSAEEIFAIKEAGNCLYSQ